MKIPHLEKILIIILVCIILFSIKTPKPTNEQYRRTIDSLTYERDLLEQKYLLTKDSLEIAFNTIRHDKAILDSLRSQIATSKKRYEKIVYRNYTDHQRDSVLRTIYPSFRNR
jgi:hypothetical protein